MEAVKKKNGKIELFRFLFTMAVVFYHAQKHYFTADTSTIHLAFFRRGYLGVEFFFLVTGYLMANTAYKRMLEKPEGGSLGLETADFIRHKILGFLPYHIAAFAVLLLAWLLEKHRSIQDIIAKLIEVFPGFTLLGKMGFDYGNINRVEWYLSAMIFALLILYPLCRRYYSMFVYVLAPWGGYFYTRIFVPDVRDIFGTGKVEWMVLFRSVACHSRNCAGYGCL